LKPGGQLRVSIASANPDDVIQALKAAGFKNVQKMPNFTPPKFPMVFSDEVTQWWIKNE
jgi:hypothetical protein